MDNGHSCVEKGEPVLCRRCEQSLKGEPRLVGVQDGERSAAPSVRTLLCDRCGVVLPAQRPDDDLLRRLTQFARFGIGAGSGPLLSREIE